MEHKLSRRQMIAGTVAASALAANANAAPRTSSRPNFLVMLMDDLGLHDLGFLGATDLKTPNIDGLAASGARFTNWYSNAPVCAPARACLQTGRVPIRAGVPNNGMALPPSEKTIASLLKPAGYETALVGKWHLGSTPDTIPNAHGYDYFYGFHAGCTDYYSHRFYWGDPRIPNYHDLWRNRDEIFENGQYLTERIAEESVRFIRANRSEPFFLCTTFNAVHYPMHAPNSYLERFRGLGEERQMYAAMLAAADDAVGDILAALDEIGQRDNTLIFFLGDNGATTEKRAGLHGQFATAGSNAPFRGYKFSVFDGGMHVPAAMSWQGKIPKGQTIHELLMTADILPTICSAAGVEVPMDRVIDGRNALPVAASGAKSTHTEIFWANGQQLAVRRGKWKLVINGIVYDGTPDGHRPLTGDDALFLSDLEQDPGESHNLRHEHPELVDQLSSAAHRWLQEVKSNSNN
jgi:arylsulfatase A-like enzyme